MARQITKRRKMTPERRRELDLKYRTFKERSKRSLLNDMDKIMGGYYAPYISGEEEFGATKGPLGGKRMKKGGKVKKTKSHRGDGIAKRGRTKGRIV